MVPLIGPGYRPVDADERGMWQQMERVEEEIAGSNLVVQDAALNPYLKRLIGKVGGPAARDGAYHQGTVWAWLIGPFVTSIPRESLTFTLDQLTAVAKSK